jgi:hydrogenase nickel incorporation protein HypA/HybF
MHELAIADAIVRIAGVHARERRVTMVEVRIGRLRQVVPDSLEFAFGLSAEGTPVEGAQLDIVDVPARIACRWCGTESVITEFLLACPSCGSLDAAVVAGEELVVEAIELEDENAVARTNRLK